MPSIKYLIKRVLVAIRCGMGVYNRIKHSYFSERSGESLNLQVGCGPNRPVGWLNSDYLPLSKGVLHIDARQPLPFSDCTFDTVYSEHMIEHIDLNEGISFVREVSRVLKPGGVFRVATPNIAFLGRLLDEDRSEELNEYMSWALKEIGASDVLSGEDLVINNFFRAWGHKFIYSEFTLSRILIFSGFSDVYRADIGDSHYPHLRNMENPQRIGEKFYRIETMVFEAVKECPGS